MKYTMYNKCIYTLEKRGLHQRVFRGDDFSVERKLVRHEVRGEDGWMFWVGHLTFECKMEEGMPFQPGQYRFAWNVVAMHVLQVILKRFTVLLTSSRAVENIAAGCCC